MLNSSKNKDKKNRINEIQSQYSGSEDVQRKQGELKRIGTYRNVIENLHGSARFATIEEIHKAGLLTVSKDKPSVVVGAVRDSSGKNNEERVRYLFHSGPEHIFVFAPTRSGKGVALIIPTLLTYDHSVICLDIKGENYVQTAGYRHLNMGQKVLKFDPTNPTMCSRHNMFAEVRWGSVNEQQDVQNVSLTMVESEDKWDHWHATAQELLICIMTDLSYRGIVEDRERKEKLAEELEKDEPDAVAVYELKKPIQGNPGAAADIVSDAVPYVLSSLAYDHVAAFEPVRGEKMARDCPFCKEEGYDTVIGIDAETISSNKGIKELIGDNTEYTLHEYNGDRPRRLAWWCENCLEAAAKDPTAKPPVWQTQPGWVINYKKGTKTKKVVRRTHPKVYLNGISFLSKPEDERGSVRSTLATRLVLFQDPIIAKNTSYCDWRIRDLMYNDKPVSLYLVFSPNDINRLAPLIRLLVAQIGRTFTAEMEFKDGATLEKWMYRLLFLLDEFPSIGKIEIMENLYAYMAGYGVKGMTITQDLTQLKRTYGDKESITANHHGQIAYAPNTLETAKYISESLGKTTVTYESESVSKSGGIQTGLFNKDSKSYAINQSARDLLSPDEVKKLKGIDVKRSDDGEVILNENNKPIIDGGEMVIQFAGMNPILGTRALFFMDPEFLRRTKISNSWEADMFARVSNDPELIGATTINEDEREYAYKVWFERYLKMKFGKKEIESVNEIPDLPDDIEMELLKKYGDDCDLGGLGQALSDLSKGDE